MENRNKSNNGPIRFPFSVKPILEEVPDFDEMGIEELKAYHQELEEALAKLDAAEPKNENSDAYEDWAQDHEDLEDLLDEVLDCIEDRS